MVYARLRNKELVVDDRPFNAYPTQKPSTIKSTQPRVSHQEVRTRSSRKLKSI